MVTEKRDDQKRKGDNFMEQQSCGTNTANEHQGPRGISRRAFVAGGTAITAAAARL